MSSSTKLRHRVTLAFAVLGSIVSIILAGAFYVLTINMEERLIAETLSAELEDYIKRFQNNPAASPPASTMIRTYVITPSGKNTPEVLRNLNPGLHHVQMLDKYYYAEVRLHDDRHFIVLYNDEQVRHRENQIKLFFAFGVIVMTILSAFLGYWLAGRVVYPVVELAGRVADLRPVNQPELVARDFTQDEVGILAREFDAYQQRLAAFIEREQFFTADVSHELRTPLSVMEGAVEVLLDDVNLTDVQCARVQRIARSVREMSELVNALLLLAREDSNSLQASDCNVDTLLEQVVEDHQYLLRKKTVDLELNIRSHLELPVECTLLRVVLANLVRNAFSYTQQGSICIYLDEQGVTVRDTGVGMEREQIEKIFDRHYRGAAGGEGIGLSLVKRICQHYDWIIDIESHAQQGATFRLTF